MLKIATPPLLTGGHDLGVQLLQLQVSALAPPGQRDALELRVRPIEAGAAGKVALKLDLATILTDILDVARAAEPGLGQRRPLTANQTNQTTSLLGPLTPNQPISPLPPGTPASRPEKAICGQRLFFPPLCSGALCPITR